MYWTAEIQNVPRSWKALLGSADPGKWGPSPSPPSKLPPQHQHTYFPPHPTPHLPGSLRDSSAACACVESPGLKETGKDPV